MIDWPCCARSRISIHALREEGDPVDIYTIANALVFQSTPSARRATWEHWKQFMGEVISIHALREEGDGVYNHIENSVAIFQSTPSARRATPGVLAPPFAYANFNPRPPRGGRPWSTLKRGGMEKISIHALREEGDPPYVSAYSDGKNISIHALREEGDYGGQSCPRNQCDFNPRPPRGGRLAKFSHFIGSFHNFNPRPPRGGRLTTMVREFIRGGISIHALREEGDPACLQIVRRKK